MKEYASDIQPSELSLVDVSAPSGEAPAVAGAVSGADAMLHSAMRHPSAASVDRFLAEASREFEGGHIDQPLWVRAVAQAGGDETLAARNYLHARATALRVARREKRAERSARRANALRGAASASGDAEARDQTKSKEMDPAHVASAILKRKQVTLVAGVLASLVIAVGLVALRSGGESTRQPDVAKPVPRASMPGVSTPKDNAASVATNTRGTAAGDVPGEQFVSKVQALKSAGNWNVLALYAVEWTRKQPGNPDAWRELSMGYVNLRQFRDALDAATKAVQLAPGDFQLWQNLGRINSALGQPASALSAFEKAAALNDQDVISLVEAGILNTQLGRVPDARIAFAKALAVSPGDVDALCGAALIAQKEGHPKDAEAMTSQVKSLDGRCRDWSTGESVRVVPSGSAKGKPLSSGGR